MRYSVKKFTKTEIELGSIDMSIFVMTSTIHGPLVVLRTDFKETDNNTFGVSHDLLKFDSYRLEELNVQRRMLISRKENFKDGVVALDIGANLGVNTVDWARLMVGWGSVLAFEPQERIYYALCSNLTINNIFNARGIWAAVGNQPGTIKVPNLDYSIPSSFGSLSLKESDENEYIGQLVDYENFTPVNTVIIDNNEFPRIDLIKIDVEGMEMEVLEGSIKSLKKHKPQLFIETIKSDKNMIIQFLEKLNYKIKDVNDLNIMAVHKDDPYVKSFQEDE